MIIKILCCTLLLYSNPLTAQHSFMRKRFEQQMSFNILAISDVKLPLKSRDELPPVLLALQHIFITPDLNEKSVRFAGRKNL